MMKSAKIISVILALCMLLTVFSLGTVSAGAADIAATGDGLVINFYNDNIRWEGPVMFYVYDPEDGSEPVPWGSEKTYGTNNGDGKWSKDVSSYGLEDGKQYCIIFVDAASGDETYDLLFDTSCSGDTAYWTGNRMENPLDSNKVSQEVRWMNASPDTNGTRKQITSIGNIVGEVIPSFTSGYQMFKDFLRDGLKNARMFSGKDDQQILDDIAMELELTKEDVAKAIAESGVNGIDWSAELSSLSDAPAFDGTPVPAATPAATVDDAEPSSTSTPKSPKTGNSIASSLFVLLVLLAAAGTGTAAYKLFKKQG